MPIVYVAHSTDDTPFVERQLVVPLPVLGVDRWVSAQRLEGSGISLAQAMAASEAVLVVVSAWAARSSSVADALEQAAQTGRAVVPVCIDDTALADVSATLAALVAVDLRRDAAQPLTSERIASALRPLLAGAATVTSDAAVEERAAPIAWDAKVFSARLAAALAQQDDSHSDELVTRLANRVRQSGVPYDVTQARQDLATLRRQRQFLLMQRYASAVHDAGIDDANVMRQYAQALIELGQVDDAIGVLHRIVAQTPRNHFEAYEARGLLGRAHKQMYVNNPGPDAGHLLLTAIGYYYDAFREDQTLTWHGINAATCIRRARRDLGTAIVEPPERIARDILDTLNRRGAEKGVDGKEKGLEAWDLATRVEALVVAGDWEEAQHALTDYLQHPGAHAFEVSSTHRQFEQVLRLQDDEVDRVLVDRLWQAVQRLRAPLALRGSDGERERNVSALVSVTDPNWMPAVPGCDVNARLGTVVAIACVPSAIKSLLDDPMVLGVTESRRTGEARECQRAVPFVRVAESYPHSAGTFTERGKNALVAVIDEGIDVLHRAFLDEHGKSRIVGVWDQRDNSGPPPPGFKFGTYHDAERIAGYVEQQEVPTALGRDPDGHGTHVASIAAGRVAGTFVGGVAPEARLVVVIADPQSAIGYSVEHIAALDFIGKVADELGTPVVVNVSQGMNAGAHDGRSLLEKGFENFTDLGSKPGRVIVKSAGNAGSARGHASIQVQAGGNAKVRWKRAKNPQWEYDCLEFWWDSADTYAFVLVAPSGERSAPVTLQDATVGGAFGDCPYRLELVQLNQFNGDSQLVVEVGSATSNARQVPAGTWAVEIKHVDGFGNAHMDGWIERGPRLPSEFLDPHVSSARSLTVPGTAANVITVGAVEVGPDDSITETPFTSRGPTRDGRSKPDVCAPGMGVVAAQGGTDDGAFADNGTSMAAPFVAGAVALVLSRAAERKVKRLPTAAQIGKVVRQKTRNRNATWNDALGFGVIDAAALLAAFE